MDILKQLYCKVRRLVSLFFLMLIKGYRYFISPLTGPRCRFYPTCSEYAMQAIKTHGPLIGLWLMIKRLLKCHPYHAGGYDPVPKPKSKN